MDKAAEKKTTTAKKKKNQNEKSGERGCSGTEVKREGGREALAGERKSINLEAGSATEEHCKKKKSVNAAMLEK